MREVARQIDNGLFEQAVLNPPKLSTALRASMLAAKLHEFYLLSVPEDESLGSVPAHKQKKSKD